MRYLILAGLLAGIFAGNASAWGKKGHRLIAEMAEKRLSSGRGNVMRKVAGILGPGATLSSLASCADSIRDYVSNKNNPNFMFPGGCIISKEEAVAMFPSTGSWHFVNIPVPAAANPGRRPDDVLTKACAERPPCILTQIEHFTDQLKDKSLDNRSRAIAVMFLVHLVGDLHQPLHAVARQNDRGGNDVFVKVGSHVGRLHQLWDTYVVEPLDAEDVYTTGSAGKGSPKTWAWESYEAALETAYAGIPVQPSSFENPIPLPDPQYQAAATQAAKRRLHSASLRLAELLTKALGG